MSTHSCFDGICIQHRKPEIEVAVLVVGSLLVVCCCLACMCDAQGCLPRCVFTFLMVGVFMAVLGLSMWDLTGPVEWRPLIMAGSVLVPLGLVGLCFACCQKDQFNQNLIMSQFVRQVIVVDRNTREAVVLDQRQVAVQDGHVVVTEEQLRAAFGGVQQPQQLGM